MIEVKKGLNVPISGSPSDVLDISKNSRSVALLGSDYPGMRPTMLVEKGDKVKLGQPLFEDKKILVLFLHRLQVVGLSQ